MPKMNVGFPQEPVLLEERYKAKLKECKEYPKDYGDGPVEKVAWIFEVEADADALDPSVDFEGEPGTHFDVAAHTSKATGPNSNFAKLNLSAFVGEDWDGDTDSLIGKECIVDVTSYEAKGGQVRNVIEKVRLPKDAPKKGETAKKSSAKKDEVDIEEADFADLPF